MASPTDDAAPSSRSRGRDFELAAERHLGERGLRVMVRNYTCRGGEIDLIMRDGAVIAFVEVRYRRSNRYGSAAESIDGRKQARIIRAASHFLLTHRQFADSPCRFDVVAIDGEAHVTDWIAGAFSA